MSIGRRQTFYTGEGPRLLEAHLLDFDGDLYGQTIRVELAGKLRDQQRFCNLHGLVAQLRVDVEGARAWDSRTPDRRHSGADRRPMDAALK